MWHGNNGRRRQLPDAESYARSNAAAGSAADAQAYTDSYAAADAHAQQAPDTATDTGTHAEAVDLFKSSRPRMVLADIQLADGSSGIDAVNAGFVGQLPPELGESPGMPIFNVAGNELTGPLPEGYASWTALTEFYLSEDITFYNSTSINYIIIIFYKSYNYDIFSSSNLFA